MNKVLLIFLLYIFSCSVYGQTTEFNEQVISHRQGRSSYFVVISVKSKSFSGKVVVECFNLFDYLEKAKGLEEKKVKSLMLKLLNEKQALEMKNAGVDSRGLFLSGRKIPDYTFRIVKPSQSFEEISAQGCKKLLEHFFSPKLVEFGNEKESTCKENIKRNAKDLFIMPRFDLIEQHNVIMKLFELGIRVSRDDMSGSLKIAYSTLK